MRIKETPQEKHFRSMLPDGFREHVEVSMRYQEYFRIINKHLKTIYGSRADWREGIKYYSSSSEYKSNSHVVGKCEDIPVISRERLLQMLQDDTAYEAKVNKLLKLYNGFTATRSKDKVKEREVTLKAAEILGILPRYNPQALYSYLINRDHFMAGEQKQMEEQILRYEGELSIAVNLLVHTFVPGMQLTFPNIGTVVTQQKGKYYYRGENAFYGSSKPGLYRRHDKKLPDDLAEFIGWIKINEGCCFLDQFDAVKSWGDSAVNYVALVQHYGMQTMMMDVTSALKTALFFACCRFGADGKWHPLSDKEIRFKDSRKDVAALGGDSRYGIIYRSLAEITDMKWAVADDNAGMNIITPVGYQPFMRCSSQHAYMLLVNTRSYDMLKDSRFDKFRIRLDEELCRWIYEEMDEGNKIYPHNDIPDMTSYMEKIRKSHLVSQKAYELAMEKYQLSNEKMKACRRVLTLKGYTVTEGEVEYITYKQLSKINRRYGIEEAVKCTGVEPRMSPLLRM